MEKSIIREVNKKKKKKERTKIKREKKKRALTFTKERSSTIYTLKRHSSFNNHLMKLLTL